MNSPVIYPGTFDPITLGHIDIITRAQAIFNKPIIVAVAKSPAKKPLLSWEERVSCAEEALKHLSAVKVIRFDKLLVDFAQEWHASILLRGLRTIMDCEFEFQLAAMNKKLAANLETIFLPPSPEFMYVSSSLVREITELGGNVSDFVPKVVLEVLLKKRT